MLSTVVACWLDFTLKFIGCDTAVSQPEHPIASASDILIMSHHDDRQPLGMEFVEEIKDGSTRGGIQISRWFVRQDDRGGSDQGAGYGNTLLLPAGELSGAMSKSIAEADTAEHPDRLLMSILTIDSPVEEGHLDVFGDRQLGDEIEGLEHEADLSATNQTDRLIIQSGDIASIKPVLTGGRLIECAQ